MFKTYMMAGLLGSAMLAGGAYAQTATTPAATPITSESAATTGQWRASKLVGVNVYNANNELLGSISDMLTDQTGAMKSVVIGVGGFLGVGEHLVAVPFEQIKFVNEPIVTASSSGIGGGGPAVPGGSATRPSQTTGAATAPAARNPWYPDHAVLNATKDQLKAMTEFKYVTTAK